MILFGIFVTMLVLLAIVGIAIGGAFLAVFGDLIVFILMLVLIRKLIKKIRKK